MDGSRFAQRRAADGGARRNDRDDRASFGSLLLLGGKLGDLFGRKWTLIGGLVGFSIASAISGLAQSFGMLVIARTLHRLILGSALTQILSWRW